MNFLNKFAKPQYVNTFGKSLVYQPKNYLHFPAPGHGHLAENPGLTVKRIIRCVRDRLVQFDPHRWESVPFTFNTNFRDEDGGCDIATCIHVHEALEREFLITVNDKAFLCQDIRQCFYIVLNSHDAN
mmetsp:Transcript_32378/g.29190  ORF Transcript_32378/g.29190 Transcript_32378/m.29190 type:complete len:128 (+) Transcript_32378:66-449(+)